MSFKCVLVGVRFHVPQFYLTPSNRDNDLVVGRKGHGRHAIPAKSLKKLVFTLLAVPVPAKVFCRYHTSLDQ
jgi:hypothetical protein